MNKKIITAALIMLLCISVWTSAQAFFPGGRGPKPVKYVEDSRHLELERLFRELLRYRKVLKFAAAESGGREKKVVEELQAVVLREMENVQGSEKLYDFMYTNHIAGLTYRHLNRLTEVSPEMIRSYNISRRWFENQPEKSVGAVLSFKAEAAAVFLSGYDRPIEEILRAVPEHLSADIEGISYVMDMDNDGVLGLAEYNAVVMIADYVDGREYLKLNDSLDYLRLSEWLYDTAKSPEELVKLRQKCLMRLEKKERMEILSSRFDELSWQLDFILEKSDPERIAFYEEQIETILKKIEETLARAPDPR